MRWCKARRQRQFFDDLPTSSLDQAPLWRKAVCQRTGRCLCAEFAARKGLIQRWIAGTRLLPVVLVSAAAFPVSATQGCCDSPSATVRAGRPQNQLSRRRATDRNCLRQVCHQRKSGTALDRHRRRPEAAEAAGQTVLVWLDQCVSRRPARLQSVCRGQLNRWRWR
jgi:hypothetical protein